uniref:Uncharacterized protein n=1 Tax=Oryza meridionalis TaxID=40149 RepID=A0A0E0C4R5_9ORYZ
MVSEPSIHGVSSVGKIYSDVPCNSLSDLDKDGAHGTNAHQLFDEMLSQHEVSEDDSRVQEKSLDDALDQIMEKLELMEAKRRQNEKIDRILEKFNEMEKRERESMQRRRDIMEELSTNIKATTTVIMAAPYSPPMAPSPSLPTNCSTECPYASSPIDGENKDQTPYIVIRDLPNVMPAKCSTNCSIPNVVPNLTVVAMVTCALTNMDSKYLEVGEDITCTTSVDCIGHPKDTHKVFDDGHRCQHRIKQAVVVFPLMFSPLEIITVLIELSHVMELKLDVFISVGNKVSIGCPQSDKQLVEHPYRNPWPPPYPQCCNGNSTGWMPPWLPLIGLLEAREGKCFTTDFAAIIIPWNEQKKMMTIETCTCFERKMQKSWDPTFQAEP